MIKRFTYVNQIMKEKMLTFAIPEENAKFVESIRVFNVKIPLKSAINSILPLLRKGKICLNCGVEKESGTSDWCDECWEQE